jgi:hypothetical protein
MILANDVEKVYMNHLLSWEKTLDTLMFNFEKM